MAPKGSVSTRLNPLRLNTINHLRVRRPNQYDQNPCVTIMSSMLSTSTPPPLRPTMVQSGYGGLGYEKAEFIPYADFVHN